MKKLNFCYAITGRVVTTPTAPNTTRRVKIPDDICIKSLILFFIFIFLQH